MLFGTYERKVDAKGRVAIPVPFRRELSEGRYAIAPDPEESCLLGFDIEAFRSRLDSAPLLGSEAGKQSRSLLSRAVAVEPDGNGRVVLPAGLRDYAGIVREVVFVGLGDNFRIHRSEGFASYDAASGPAVHTASAWTGMKSPAERAHYIATVGPHILRSFREWIDEWDRRRGNAPPDLLFPEELLADLRGLHESLTELLEDIDAGRFSDDALNSFVQRSLAWLKGYKKALSGAVADTVYGAPAMIGVVGFAGSLGMLEQSATSLATGILAGSLSSSLMQRRKAGE